MNLHTQLAADCIVLGQFPLSTLLLMNDANYPWCILVPDREAVTEIYQLSAREQTRLLRESSGLGEAMMSAFDGDKLNIAALGNVVPQLHVHHIVRYHSDAAWPAPVWGFAPAVPYSEEQLTEVWTRIRSAIEAVGGLELREQMA